MSHSMEFCFFVKFIANKAVNYVDYQREEGHASSKQKYHVLRHGHVVNNCVLLLVFYIFLTSTDMLKKPCSLYF